MNQTTETVVTPERIVSVTVTTTVTERERIVDFGDILNAIDVQPDDYSGYPWDSCDMYGHVLRGPSYYDNDDFLGEYFGVVQPNRMDRCIVELSDKAEKAIDDSRKWYRENGCARGIANQLASMERRRVIEQIVKWLEGLFESWYVSGTYNDFEADGLSGIDDWEYANTEVRLECALGIASQMEKAGYIVDRQVTASPPVKRSPGNVNLFDVR